MAARFWRAVSFDTRGGGDLELSTLEFSDAGGRIDNLALLGSTIAPASGALASLQDADAGTSCVFAAAAARAPGFALLWDFGAGVSKDIFFLRIGAGASAAVSAERLELHSSADALNWTKEWGVFNIPVAVPGNPLDVALTSYNAQVLASGPVAFWPLDETAGTTAVDLVAGRNGTRTNGSLITPGIAPFSPACFAPNSTGLITVPSAAAFDLTTLTLELWLKTATATNLVLFERNGNNGFSMQTSGPSASAYYAAQGTHTNGGFNGSFFNAVGSSVSVSTNQPLHIVTRMSPSAMTVHVNGVNQTKGTQGAFAPTYNGQPLMIGSRGGAAGLDNGAIDKVAIYGKWLSDAEIYGHYVGGKDFSVGANYTRTSQAGVLRLATPLPTTGLTLQANNGLLRDLENGGLGRVSGTVKEKSTPADVPLRRRIVLLDERSHLPVRETWSDAVTGNYEFRGVKQGVPYTVLSYDHTGAYRAVVADGQIPEMIV